MVSFLDFIDLSDESGSLKNLQSHPLDYGTKYLNEREILILVKGESKLPFFYFSHLRDDRERTEAADRSDNSANQLQHWHKLPATRKACKSRVVYQFLKPMERVVCYCTAGRIRSRFR